MQEKPGQEFVNLLEYVVILVNCFENNSFIYILNIHSLQEYTIDKINRVQTDLGCSAFSQRQT